MSVLEKDGNVIRADFGKRPEPLLNMRFSCRMLYSDDHVALARLTYRSNGQEFMQHVCTGGGD